MHRRKGGGLLICGEAYVFWNLALPMACLPLGGYLAGLPGPKGRRVWQAGLMAGCCSLGALRWPGGGALWLMALPLGVMRCFGAQRPGTLLRCTFTSLCAACLTAGVALALAGTGLPPVLSAAAAVGAAGLLGLMVRLRPQALTDVTQVELRMADRAVILPAMLDSGNLLGDPITGLPVVVAPGRGLMRLFPGVPDLHDLSALPLGFRLLSVRTAAGAALMPIFRPDGCRLYVNGRAREARVQVAVAGPEYAGVQALVPLSALGHGEGGDRP